MHFAIFELIHVAVCDLVHVAICDLVVIVFEIAVSSAYQISENISKCC